ncbi:hypothetical protein [Flindersiella endophytica]
MPAELVRRRRSGPFEKSRSWIVSLLRRRSSKAMWELEKLLFVPAKGETYDFVVDATGTWVGSGIWRFGLNRRIRKYETDALRRVQAISRSVARRYPPQEPGLAELAMNEDLNGGWLYDDNVRFEVAVQVDVDEELRHYLTEAMNARINLENNAAFSRRQTELLDELVPRWQEVLTKVGRDLEAVHASRLADANGEFANSVNEIIQEGKARSKELLALLENSVRAHKDMDLYEFTTSYDSALSAFMTYMGIPSGQEGKDRPPTKHANGRQV